jgi:rRNA maturation endonuclease Nob1
MKEICCHIGEIEICDGKMYYYDCEGILRTFEIKYCPFCGEKFEKEKIDKPSN